ncbi:toll/interleukin-1 receptor domain-containing protein [Amycolatopsis pittospori]|uniref:toll/interleukin-1 receptor domain-containing protein n=1 Tax=Amycolatopsis pittospori TaxID=2749434 RepID=UPI0015EFEBC6|nr:toll/interleukin-1 receptor domain-containing protein [Amycolatopsis pittospori]
MQAHEISRTPQVFISYTHDSDHHCDQVRDFATLLVNNGIVVELDQWATGPRQDWQVWATRFMTSYDYVLVVASEGYRRMGDGNGPADRNLGGQAEAALLRDLLQGDRKTWTAKILPVLLPGQDIEGIPLFLQPYAADRYPIASLTVEGADGLLRTITGQPRHLRPPLGRPLVLPPESGPGAGPS